MKKMVMVLIMVFGLSAIFADSYVAFTNKKGLVLYNNNDQTAFNTYVKSLFEGATSDYTDKEKKNSALIVVTDVQHAIHIVLVGIDVKNPKLYWVFTGDLDKNGEPEENTFKSFIVETDLKTDPVTVGLSFIKEKVIQINNVDKNKVVYQMCITE